AEIEATVHDFVTAARVAQAAGFDAVEVHCGHGYLISQFLSPLFNRRRDAWGGDLQGRSKLAVSVVGAIRSALGPGFPILVKLNTSDGLRGGLEVEESAQVARWLVDAGASGIVPTGGLVQRTAFFLLRGQLPLQEMVRSERHLPQKWALRLFAPLYVRPYPYTPLFFRKAAGVLRDAVDVPVGLLGGVEGSATIRAALAEGFAFVVMGRALIADPDLVARIARGEAAETRCTHCNICVGRTGAHPLACVLPDDVS
ncbi:MAG: NADH:flavin oxidoreductase, partial [Myxococcota bacterium]